MKFLVWLGTLLFAGWAQAGAVALSLADSDMWATYPNTPAVYGDAGTFLGRDHVLQIIFLPHSPREEQGVIHDVSGGVGDTFTMQAYIPAGWGDRANGLRQEREAVFFSGPGGAADDAVILFTNLGGTGQFEVLDSVWGIFRPLGSAVYGAWNTLSIELGAGEFTYGVNGAFVTLVANDPRVDAFDQAAFLGTAFPDSGPIPGGGGDIPPNTAPYGGLWASPTDQHDDAVPEPPGLSLVCASLLGAVFWTRRSRQKA